MIYLTVPAQIIIFLTSFCLGSNSNSIHESPGSKCTTFDSSSICNPWNQKNLKLDLERLALVYKWKGGDFGVKEWEGLVANATTGHHAEATSKRLWKNWATCPKYQGEAIQYAKSYVCLMDIFIHSRKCNSDLKDDAIPAFCSSVCKGYSQALSHLVSNTTICTDVDGDQDQDADGSSVVKRRLFVKKLRKKCAKISLAPFFDQSKCIMGVETDQISCGFGGNATIAKTFCEKYPDEQCCSSLKSLPSFNAFAPIHDFFQSFTSTTSNSTTSPIKPAQSSKSSTVTIIIISILAVVVFIACVIVFRFYYRRRTYQSADIKDKGKSIDDTTTLVEKDSSADSNSIFGFSSFFAATSTAGASSEVKKLRCIVKYAYTPNLPDEIELQVGDIVEFESISDDGWGVCTNTSSGENGQACTRFMEIID